MKNNTYTSACSTLYDKFLTYIVFDEAFSSFIVANQLDCKFQEIT